MKSNPLKDLISSLPESDRYGVLFEALECAIENETDRGYLGLIAAQLYELSEKALKLSGINIIHDENKMIN